MRFAACSRLLDKGSQLAQRVRRGNQTLTKCTCRHIATECDNSTINGDASHAPQQQNKLPTQDSLHNYVACACVRNVTRPEVYAALVNRNSTKTCKTFCNATSWSHTSMAAKKTSWLVAKLHAEFYERHFIHVTCLCLHLSMLLCQCLSLPHPPTSIFPPPHFCLTQATPTPQRKACQIQCTSTALKCASQALRQLYTLAHRARRELNNWRSLAQLVQSIR